MTSITTLPAFDQPIHLLPPPESRDVPAPIPGPHVGRASNDEVFVDGKAMAVNTLRGEGGRGPASVEEAIVQFKEHVQSLRRELEFTFDEETRQVIVKVHDSETGEVVRQIPSEEFVAMARRLDAAQKASLIDTEA